MKNRKNIYVVVCKNDKPLIFPSGKERKKDPDGEVVMETYTKFASLNNAKKWVAAWDNKGSSLGGCRIAKLQFLTEYSKE